jgi:MbtH protein
MEYHIVNRVEQEDTTISKTVVNHEEQYSSWPANRKNLLGWKAVSTPDTAAACMAYIKGVWTDMRPLHSYKAMAGV